METANRKHRSRGYTLVEVMVAMVITLIIMGGVYQAMVDENVNQERSENILEMQNNARVAMTGLITDIRRAGFLGCGGDESAITLSNKGSNAWVQPLTIADAALTGGVDWDGSQSLIATETDQVTSPPIGTIDYLGEALGFLGDAPSSHPIYAEGTDAITLAFLSGETMVDPDNAMASGTDIINLKSKAFKQDDILVATDCSNYSVFQKTNGDSTFSVEHAASGLNNSADLVSNYGVVPARVYQLTTATYFIHYNSSQKSFDFCYNSISDPVASNIEDLQFQFLFDEDEDGNLTEETWQNSLGTHKSTEVRAIRIFLLAMSVADYGYTDNNTYDYPNSPYYTPDPNSTYRDENGNLKPGNPYGSANGSGGSPASKAPMNYPTAGEHRHRYLASAVVMLRNAGLKK